MNIKKVVFKENYAKIEWESDELGWGEIQFHIKKDGSLKIDSETMDREFVKFVLESMVDGATLRDYNYPDI
jgi:hypothetical protein